MVAVTKSGAVAFRSRIGLVEFLRGVSGTSGKVTEDVALFVPVALGSGESGVGSRESGVGNGGAVTKAAGDSDGGAVPWVFSTFDLDRMDERVDPAGWDIEMYRRNPVVQWAHRFDVPAIGRAVNLAVDGAGLRGAIVFNAKDYDSFGWSIGERVRAGVLRAGSVGFRVLEIELPDSKTASDGTCLIFRKQELLEFSICNVPANPFALGAGVGNRESGVGNGGAVTRAAGAVGGFWGGVIGK